MNIFWNPILRPLLIALKARRVIEIGADGGRNSVRLARWCRANGAFAEIIDPAPAFDAADFGRQHEGAARVHLAPSLEVLPDLAPADLVLIDGDHNWYTVYHEIEMLLGPVDHPRADPPVLVFHDTGWPWGRRDSYYAPDRIPEAFRHPYAYGQISPDAQGWSPMGMDLGLPCAKIQGGPRNGVRTAIEDALTGREAAFVMVTIPAFNGLTLLVPQVRLTANPELAALLQEVTPAPAMRPVLDLMERSRIDGMIARYLLGQVFHPPSGAEPHEAGDRPLQTALGTEVWQGIQQGMMRQTYKGRSFLLSPFDQYNFTTAIETLRPGTIFEIGTHEGGRALWMADQLRAFGIGGRVLAMDIAPPAGIVDPLVEVVTANAMDLGEVLTPARLASLPRPWLVIEDAAHTTVMSRTVLDFFDPHLQPGDRIVIEDGNTGSLVGQPEHSAPHAAIQAFLALRGQDYRIETEYCDRYGHNLTANPNGWLVRC